MAKRRYQNQKSDRKIIVIASDLHAGHRLGLMNPEKITAPQNEALSRICEKVFELPQQPDEFTASQVAEKTGMNEKQVAYRLEKKVKKGILTRREGLNHAGYHSILYKYVEEKES